MRDPRIRPLEDPNPITPREDVDKIDTSDLPKYIKTADEWWLIVDRIWPAILDIADRVNANDAYIKMMEEKKLARDRKLAGCFNHLWFEAPDAYFIHTWPQWSRFCDLCSECGVLYDEEE